MSIFFFFLLLFISAIPAIYGQWPMAQLDLPCHASVFSQVLGGSREALRRGGATAGDASQPRRCEGPLGTEKYGAETGPIGIEGPIWVRKDDFWRCRFFRYFLIEWKYSDIAKEKMANGYPPMVGFFFALKTMSC